LSDLRHFIQGCRHQYGTPDKGNYLMYSRSLLIDNYPNKLLGCQKQLSFNDFQRLYIISLGGETG